MLNFLSMTFNPSAVDEQALTIFITGISVVSLALWTISIVLRQFQRVLNRKEYKAAKQQAAEKTEIQPIAKSQVETIETNEVQVISSDDETQVAIAMALHMYYSQQHDDESYVLTIKTSERLASPWAQKKFNTLQK
ncbi:MAG: OadG family protein [Bacteroidales bacterium]|nr:OadG family protein [Bacteroidales bacterium]